MNLLAKINKSVDDPELSMSQKLCRMKVHFKHFKMKTNSTLAFIGAEKKIFVSTRTRRFPLFIHFYGVLHTKLSDKKV